MSKAKPIAVNPIGIDGFRFLSGGRQGWPAILSSLKSLLETGQPLVIKMQPPQRMLAALKELGVKLPGQQ